MFHKAALRLRCQKGSGADWQKFVDAVDRATEMLKIHNSADVRPHPVPNYSLGFSNAARTFSRGCRRSFPVM